MTSENHSSKTSLERVIATMSGGQCDHVPTIPILREWCSRQAGINFVEEMSNAEMHVYAQYYCLKRFGYDAVWDLQGVHAESEAMGSVLKIREGFPPSIAEYAVKNYESDLQKLMIPNPYKGGRLPGILNGITRLKELCKDRVPVIGYVQAPLRHASMLRGSENIMRDMRKRREYFSRLMEIATDSQIVYGSAVAHSGADIILLADPTSSGDLISRQTWEEFVYPYTLRLVNALKRTGVKIIMHICGDTTDRLEALVKTGVDCLSLDYKVDFEYARKVLGDHFCLMGNVDPNILTFGTPEQVEEASREVLLKAGKKGNFILSAGCMVPEAAPAENMDAFVSSARKYGTYST
jgi:uroporphyrinogen decarboxylase